MMAVEVTTTPVFWSGNPPVCGAHPGWRHYGQREPIRRYARRPEVPDQCVGDGRSRQSHCTHHGGVKLAAGSEEMNLGTADARNDLIGAELGCLWAGSK
jgi:hypothetical protein